jgi:hypothetical protein
MNATTNRFNRSFDDDPIRDGSEYIVADLGGGVTVRAFIEHDGFQRPDDEDDWATAEDIESFYRDEWHYCEMYLSVYLGEACIEEAVACMTGIAVGRDGDGEHLTDVANELLNQTDVALIVRDHAAKATAAARAMKQGGAS